MTAVQPLPGVGGPPGGLPPRRDIRPTSGRGPGSASSRRYESITTYDQLVGGWKAGLAAGPPTGEALARGPNDDGETGTGRVRLNSFPA